MEHFAAIPSLSAWPPNQRAQLLGGSYFRSSYPYGPMMFGEAAEAAFCPLPLVLRVALAGVVFAPALVARTGAGLLAKVPLAAGLGERAP